MSNNKKINVKRSFGGVIVGLIAVIFRIVLRIDDEVLPIMFNIDEATASVGYIVFWLIFCIACGRNIRSMRLSRGVAAITLISALAYGAGMPLVDALFPISGCIVTGPRVILDAILAVLSIPTLYTLSGIHYADFLNFIDYVERFRIVGYIMIAISLVWYIYSAARVRRLKKQAG